MDSPLDSLYGYIAIRLAFAEKKTPALKIEPGSVAIAGIQTGIYPTASPGGWHIIGRTPIAIFDKNETHPVFWKQVIM